MSYQQALIHQTDIEVKDNEESTFTMCDWQGTGDPQLARLRTKSTVSGQVEIQIFTRQGSPGVFTSEANVLNAQTAFKIGVSGTFLLADFTGSGKDDLIFVHTGYWPTISVASASSNYALVIYKQRIPISYSDIGSGVWTTIRSSRGLKPDLAFIKTGGVKSGRAEVRVLSGSSDYQTFIEDCGSVLKSHVLNHGGAFFLFPFTTDKRCDLIWLKLHDTQSKKIEIYVAGESPQDLKYGSKYGKYIHEQSIDIDAPCTNGSWQFVYRADGRRPDIYYIETRRPDNRIRVYCLLSELRPENELETISLGDWSIARMRRKTTLCGSSVPFIR